MTNARYRPHTKSGPKDGRTMEEAAAVKACERFLERFTKVARRRGWVVRKDWR